MFDLGKIDYRRLRETERRLEQASRAPKTMSTYESGWRSFQEWCSADRRATLPADESTVSDFTLWCLNEDSRLNTVSVRLSAIAYQHRQAGFEAPVNPARRLLRLAKRDRKEKPQGRAALTPEQLRSMLSRYSRTDPLDLRNKTILLLHFACGWRGSEVLHLDLEDIRFVAAGMTLWQGFSKTDQSAEGRLVAINAGKGTLTNPVRALQDWIDMRGSWPGPLFVRMGPNGEWTRKRLVSGSAIVNRIVKDGLRRIQVDPANYGSHSNRAGMITASAENGADLPSIMHRTGHKSVKMVMHYVRPAQAFRRDPLAGVL